MGTPRRKDYSGHRYGKVTWLRFLEVKGTNSIWEVQCDCGTVWKLPSSQRNRTKSCGCVHWDGVQDSVVNSMFRHYLEGAKRRNLEFSISKDDVKMLSERNCEYCGVAPEMRRYSYSQKARPANGIDRVDSNRGYILENCVPCCRSCNFMKSNLSLEEFLKKVELIYLKKVKI